MSHNHSRVVVLMATFALLQIGLLIAPCLNLQNGLFPGKRDWVVQWLPFAALRGQPFLTAAVDVLSSMVIFGTLTLTLVVLLRRMRAVYANWWALAALTLISITRESLRFSTFGTPMDMTTLLVAWSSAYLVIGPLRVMEVAAAVRGAAASGLGSAPELRYIELTKRSFRR